MKNLRNLLKKVTAVMLLAAILFTGSANTTTWNDADYGIMPLGDGTLFDYREF